jgi:hypothetical protein
VATPKNSAKCRYKNESMISFGKKGLCVDHTKEKVQKNEKAKVANKNEQSDTLEKKIVVKKINKLHMTSSENVLSGANSNRKT